MNIKHKLNALLAIVLLLSLPSCRKFVEVSIPKTSLIKQSVFTSDATAAAAISDLYGQMTISSVYSSGTIQALSYLGGLSSDELDLFSTNPVHISYFSNNLDAQLSIVNNSFWSPSYQQIFRANAILEGLMISSGLNPSLKLRLEGEAKFIRAFAYFYLVNLFGDVPLVLTTDYRVNAVMPRTSKGEIYQQVIKDLKDAQNLLDEGYLNVEGQSTFERTRVNKFAATSMLARVFLYLANSGDNSAWSKAEEEATKVINHNALYGGEDISRMFLKNSKEAIWQLRIALGNANEAAVFAFSSKPNTGSLKSSFYLSFENSDLRKANWIIVRTFAGNTYYQPAKYRATAASPITEYSTVLRLGEQYLIRAEARAHQSGKVLGINSAESDLNYIRNRAGLGSTSATNEATMLTAIEQERRFELFTEWGHRWLDLKRTNRANIVLGPLKGVNWQTTDQLWPIPQIQIQNDPAMANQQNPGYN